MFTATLHKPSLYSLNGVQSVNGSDQNGGCPSRDTMTFEDDEDLFGFIGRRYCASSIGVISDGIASIGDLSRPDWASGLYTIKRTSQDITSVRLAFRFKSQVNYM